MSESLAVLKMRRDNLAKDILRIEQEIRIKSAAGYALERLHFRLDIQKRALADVNRQISRRGEMVG